jgi:hypothetical protein
VAAAPTTYQETEEEGEAAPVAAQITQGLPGLPGGHCCVELIFSFPAGKRLAECAFCGQQMVKQGLILFEGRLCLFQPAEGLICVGLFVQPQGQQGGSRCRFRHPGYLPAVGQQFVVQQICVTQRTGTVVYLDGGLAFRAIQGFARLPPDLL